MKPPNDSFSTPIGVAFDFVTGEEAAANPLGLKIRFGRLPNVAPVDRGNAGLWESAPLGQTDGLRNGLRLVPYPKGISPQSPWLRACELPWVKTPNNPFSTPIGVASDFVAVREEAA